MSDGVTVRVGRHRVASVGEVLVVFPGGPGVAATATGLDGLVAESFLEGVSEVLLIDPRGTEGPDPVNCRLVVQPADRLTTDFGTECSGVGVSVGSLNPKQIAKDTAELLWFLTIWRGG